MTISEQLVSTEIDLICKCLQSYTYARARARVLPVQTLHWSRLPIGYFLCVDVNILPFLADRYSLEFIRAVNIKVSKADINSTSNIIFQI